MSLGSNLTLGGKTTVSGAIDLPITASPTVGVITQGGASLIHSYGSSNFFAGTGAGNFTMSGAANTATGYQALASNVFGSNNVANGYLVLLNNDVGSFNVASGDQVLYNNVTGNYNVASGSQALYSNTVGSNNIGIGNQAGFNLTTGSNNIDIGNSGVAGESGIIRLGTSGTHTSTLLVGNVGIGFTTTLPTYNLEATGVDAQIGVSGAGSPGFHLNNTATGGRDWRIFSTPATGASLASGLGFFDATSSQYRMVINSTGNVGIGTTTPGSSFALDVNGAIRCIGAVNTSSDVRYKTRIETISSALDSVVKLRGVSYDWKRAEFPEKRFDDRRQIGFIAQELRTVFPELVTEDNEGFLSVAYSAVTPVLVEAIKELNAKHDHAKKEKDAEIKSLRAENADLKKRLERIESMLELGQAKSVPASFDAK